MFAKAFLKATLERAVKTFAQSLLALLAGDKIGLLDPNWVTVLSVAGMATVLSLLSSVASSHIGGPGPSAANEVTYSAAKLQTNPVTNPHA